MTASATTVSNMVTGTGTSSAEHTGTSTVERLTAAAPPTGGRRAAVWLLRAYQVGRAGHMSPCRFTPTCSEYAVQAVSAHGVFCGIALSARRLTRCRPGGTFGYDPVPPGPFSTPPTPSAIGGDRPPVPHHASSECPPVPE